MFKESLFLGVLTKPMRAFIKQLVQSVSDKYDVFYDFNCGSFSVAECALLAGVKKIKCSDIGLYASVIGYYLIGKKAALLNAHSPAGKPLKTPEEILFHYWIDKLNHQKYYEAFLYKNILADERHYLLQMLDYLNEIKLKFDKIDLSYEVSDMFISLKNADKGIYFLDPPGSLKNDYISSMKWTGAGLGQTCIKESENIYLDLLKGKNPVIIRRFREVPEKERKYIVYAERKKSGSIYKYDYLLSNIKIKTEYVNLDKLTKVNAGTYQIFGEKDLITSESVPMIKHIKKDVALYYRDLFNRGMGSTRAEQYFGFFIDGKLVGVSGFFLDMWIRAAQNYINEQFGFSIRTDLYPRINKLHMMVLTSSETARLIKQSNKKCINETPEYFRTACMTKFHEQKGNRGIMKLKERKKLDNGLFHLFYETKFYNENWHERMLQFLRKEKYDVRSGKKLQE